MEKKQRSVPRLAATGAVIAGLAAGSYGIASAATGSSTTTATSATPTQTAPVAQRGDETALTGDALAKVTAAAQARVPGATIVRVENDADGHAAYEAHMTKADGTAVAVYVDASFNVVSVETR